MRVLSPPKHFPDLDDQTYVGRIPRPLYLRLTCGVNFPLSTHDDLDLVADEIAHFALRIAGPSDEGQFLFDRVLIQSDSTPFVGYRERLEQILLGGLGLVGRRCLLLTTLSQVPEAYLTSHIACALDSATVIQRAFIFPEAMIPDLRSRGDAFRKRNLLEARATTPYHELVQSRLFWRSPVASSLPAIEEL